MWWATRAGSEVLGQFDNGAAGSQARKSLWPSLANLSHHIANSHVAETNPDNGRPLHGRAPKREIAVFGYDDRPRLNAGEPYVGVGRATQASLVNMGRLVTCRLEPGCEGRRQLLIDDELHSAAMIGLPISDAA